MPVCREDTERVKSSPCRAEVGAGLPRRYRLFPPKNSRVTYQNVGRGAHTLLNTVHGSRGSMTLGSMTRDRLADPARGLGVGTKGVNGEWRAAKPTDGPVGEHMWVRIEPRVVQH
jgi:hypothetical protein